MVVSGNTQLSMSQPCPFPNMLSYDIFLEL